MIQSPAWLQISVAALPVILAPLTAWILAQRREVRRNAELEHLKLRVDLVEKLRHLHADTTTDPTDPLAREAADILADLEALLAHDTISAPALPGISRIAGVFLLYKQRSRKASVYRGLFYFFALIGLIGFLASLTEVTPKTPGEWFARILGAVVYIGVGVAFRASAVRDNVRHSEKDRITRQSRPSRPSAAT